MIRPGPASAAPPVGAAVLARLLARYADATPPSVNEVRAAVAAFADEQSRAGAGPVDVALAVEACVREHAPPRVTIRERRAIVTLLLRWASDARQEMASARPRPG